MNGIITVVRTGADAAAIATDGSNKKALFKKFARFTDCITEINNKKVDRAKYLNVVIPMYNLIECSDNYSKTSGNSY